MLKSKILYTIEPKEYSTIGVKFSTIGIFNTEKVHWDYYAVSYFPKNGKNHVSGDIGGCNFMVELSIESVKNHFILKYHLISDLFFPDECHWIQFPIYL